MAKELLGKIGVNEENSKRVQYLIGHHHTYNNIDGLDYQILVESDFLVNLYEDGDLRKRWKQHIIKYLKQKQGRKFAGKCSALNIPSLSYDERM